MAVSRRLGGPTAAGRPRAAHPHANADLASRPGGLNVAFGARVANGGYFLPFGRRNNGRPQARSPARHARGTRSTWTELGPPLRMRLSPSRQTITRFTTWLRPLGRWLARAGKPPCEVFPDAARPRNALDVHRAGAAAYGVLDTFAPDDFAVPVVDTQRVERGPIALGPQHRPAITARGFQEYALVTCVADNKRIEPVPWR